MKSIVKVAAVILSAALLVFGTAGCQQDSDNNNNMTALLVSGTMNSNGHEHTFVTAWTSDATNHWHAATCGHTTEVSGKAAHTFGEYTSDGNATTSADGTKSRTCSVCGYKDTVTEEGTKILVPKCVLVSGGDITGAAYTNSANGVFPAGRNVRLSSFYMGKYEVTQEQYKSVMAGKKVTVSGTEYTLADSPSLCTGSNEDYKIDFGKDHGNYPVENVTWYDAVYYCNALSAKENLDPCYTITVTTVSSGHITEATVEYDKTKNGYRLPTEAEWEYAARGGDPNADDWNYTFSGADKAEDSNYFDYKNTGLDSVGWYSYNNITGTTGDDDVTDSAEGKGTHKVGSKVNGANRLRIYDMSGNVCEWCYDCYDDSETSNDSAYTQDGKVVDPVGAASGNERVYRGGSWCSEALRASVSIRINYYPGNQYYGLGFRVVRKAN